jgi:hypothetical protein
MKKAFWWILGILLSPILLFTILAVLLYLPPVQNWAVGKVADVASEKLGMQISVGHVQLSFPLDLVIDNFKLIHQPDTIADVEQLTVDVQLLPLFEKKVVINQLEVSNTRLNTNGFVEAAKVKGSFKRLFVSSRGIDLDAQTVAVNGAHLEDADLDIQLNDSVPEDTTTTETLWVINIDSVVVSRSDLAFHMPGDTMSVRAHFGTLTARDALVDLARETYTVGSADWVNGTLAYDQNYEPRIEGLDFNHIDLTHLNIGIDSIYYHDPTLRLNMRHVALKEKSGLQVTDLSGPIAMENGSIRLPKFRLKTPESDIFVNMDMPLSLLDSIDPGKIRLRVDAQIGRQDLMHFMGDLPQVVRDRWPYYPLTVKGAVKGNMDFIEFKDLDIQLPTAFYVNADGFVANVADPKRLRADVQFKANSQNLGFLMAMLPRDIQRDYRLPPMFMEGRVKVDGARYAADIKAREGSGVLSLDGNFNANDMSYSASINIEDVNIHHFMPHGPLYNVNIGMMLNGHGVDLFSPKTDAISTIYINQLKTSLWNMSDMTALAVVRNGRIQFDVESRNKLFNGEFNIDALMNTEKFVGTVSADVNHADLYALGLLESPLTVKMCGSADITSDMKMNHYVSGLISDIVVTDTAKTYRTEWVGLHLRTNTDTTIVRAQSGDLIVKMDFSGNYEKLLSQFTVLGDSAMAQIDQKNIDQPALRRLLPRMKMHVESKRDNPIANLLLSGNGMDFKDMLFDMNMSPETGVNGKGYLHSLVVSGVRLDTINFQLTQRKEHLSFGGQIRNNKKNPQFVFNALFDGILQERGATFGVRYYDAVNKLGARMGARAEVVDSGLLLHLMPDQPTLGYKLFTLNKDNYVFFRNNKKVEANINLVADDGTGMKVYSESTDSTALQDITVSLNRINLDEITSIFPYTPRMTGLLDGDYHVIQDAMGRFSMVCDMSVRNMTYEQSPIGNVNTEMVYLQKGDSAHVVEARLMKDDIEIGLVTGTYYDVGEGSMDLKFMMERLPLDLVNGFIPDQLFGLQGYGEGELGIRGPVSRFKVNGQVMLDSAYLVSVPYGVKMRFAKDPLVIEDSKLTISDFNLYSPKNDELNVNGSVDFADFDHIMTNVRLRAENYQIIDAKENKQSVAYGKAFVDFFARISGTLDNMNMRGRINVLGSTDMSYILRDSPLTTDNQLDELVKFTDFSDSTQTVVERPQLTGFKMDMTLNVSSGAHVMAYLNTDHSNYIDLMGGGALRMSYSPTDNLRLTGRYTLSNGEMKYSLPVIPLKTFTIQDGSYVEFTGDPMDPTLNITATEHTKASVNTTGGVGRTVDFDCGVIITKTLSNMGLEFTLDTPEDMQLHSELSAMGADQRAKLAVTMLTTGMYLADGNTGSFSMNSALSSFLNSQISQISGNALRTLDLQFGMDNSTDASGQTHTDYSFKFAKRFMNNRLKITVGGKVSTGAELQQRNNSFFDNVALEYRLDNNANKYVTLFFENNAYDWLDGYSQKYGGGFTWRRSMDSFFDIFKFNDSSSNMPMPGRNTSIPAPRDSVRTDSAKVKR